jgi:hypothetical protein
LVQVHKFIKQKQLKLTPKPKPFKHIWSPMQWAWPPLTITLWPSPFLHNLMVSPVLLSAISLNRKLIRKRQDQVDASSSGSSCYSLADSTRTRVLAIKLNSKGTFYASVITLWSEARCLFLAARPTQTDRQTKSPHNLRKIFYIESGSESQQLISPVSGLFYQHYKEDQ